MSIIEAGLAVADLEGWVPAEDGKSISKSFEFEDFKQAWAFMSACADKAEEMDHHPNWSNVYNVVDVALMTHDAGGVTEKDMKLARYMNEVSG
ncbi:4a-hydroxytetrahydrobiopterin dehydratase [Ponticaulis sp.]|uniref:4a-hydroxytetrahydrobiopterin dehydratase n=1 Tax=Ponticaulis sp. TaxID=2020902 RepID=UPI000B65C57F|nr:4a-hydroxytetrahydrobiopterin dehydratase [Ponticaulis sp.]MAI89936.1 4a-hydroxytetrahydrobiopterin dehydratase [Ponticaulis sp.]OUX99606.1 MAG: 4a-hydroxytetrahydrobiopterin dehydratase [Hyphomonadaceae bacterium TMED5]|tara:strand:- start:80362 stop:80640 length:279 start_codon:yes stop_codon:yes gene_type:complete